MKKSRKTGTFLDRLAKRPGGRCSFCSEPHHKPFFDVPPDGPAALHDADVQDAQTHALMEAWAVLKKHDVPESEWLSVLAPIASAIGWVGAACERFGELGAMEKFWSALVEDQGEGTYVFDVGRLPNGHGHPTRVQ